MPPDNSSRPAARPTVWQLEEHAWACLYRSCHRAEIAAAVIIEFDADPEMKRHHLALYLGCRETLRAHKARVRRRRYAVRCVLQTLRWIVVEPLLGLVQLANDAGLSPWRPADHPVRPKVHRIRRSTRPGSPLEAVVTGAPRAEHPAAAQAA